MTLKEVITTIAVAFAVSILLSPHVNAQVGRYEDDPHWLENDRFHPQNDQNQWRNNEMYPDNLRYRMDADNIIRDESGQPMGYSVPKIGGGTNYFLYGHGGRFGYSPD